MLIKKGDNVYVRSGKDRGKTGKVLKALPSVERVVVEGVNVQTRHRRARRANERGQRLEVPAPIHASNVMLVCASCKKPARVRRVAKGTSHARVCVRCGAVADAVTTG